MALCRRSECRPSQLTWRCHRRLASSPVINFQFSPHLLRFCFYSNFFSFLIRSANLCPSSIIKKRKKKNYYIWLGIEPAGMYRYFFFSLEEKKKEMYLIRFFYWVSYSFLFNMIPEKKGKCFSIHIYKYHILPLTHCGITAPHLNSPKKNKNKNKKIRIRALSFPCCIINENVTIKSPTGKKKL